MREVKMPQLGQSITEGTVVEWLKAEGDTVEEGEPLLEISTDKIDTAIESPFTGVLSAILVAEHETVGVGTVLARVEQAGGAESAGEVEAPAAAEASANDEQAASSPQDHQEDQPGHLDSGTGVRSYQRREPAHDGAGDGSDRELAARFTPGVLRLASDAGMDAEKLAQLSGSGQGGRLTKRDLVAHLRTRGEGRSQTPQPARTPAAPEDVAGEDPNRIPERYRYTPTSRDNREPLGPVRRQIADHMAWSRRISAHSAAFTDCDMTAVVDFVTQGRSDRDASAQGGEPGARVTYTVVCAYVLSQALMDYPRLNASLVDDELITKPYVHLGMAVALRDTNDLIVPVVHDAHQLPLDALAVRMEDLATRARERRLEPRDVEGGTFTLTNPGIVGGTFGVPVINQPQVAILSMNGIQKRPAVVDDEVRPRQMMILALSFDHRVVDGVLAFEFIEDLRGRLESFPDHSSDH